MNGAPNLRRRGLANAVRRQPLAPPSLASVRRGEAARSRRAACESRFDLSGLSPAGNRRLEAARRTQEARDIPLRHAAQSRKQRRAGAVAQMGERCNRTAEVRGSIPLSSTKEIKDLDDLVEGPPDRRGSRGEARRQAAPAPSDIQFLRLAPPLEIGSGGDARPLLPLPSCVSMRICIAGSSSPPWRPTAGFASRKRAITFSSGTRRSRAA